MDRDWSTEVNACSCLLGAVNRVLNDDRLSRRVNPFLLSHKPIHFTVNRRDGLVLSNELLSFRISWLGAEQSQRDWADIRPQRFPGLMA